MHIIAVVGLSLLLASGAYAQSAVRALPTEIGAFTAYVWLAMWAMLAGLVSFHQKVKAGAARWFNVGELAGELATSAFIGVLTGLVCEAAGIGAGLTYAMVGITGHAGGRAIFWLERVLQRLAESKLGITTDVEIHKEEK